MPGEKVKRVLQQKLVERILTGNGMASTDLRRKAFDGTTDAEPLGSFLRKVSLNPARTTDDDIAALKALDLSEDQIFELIICSAVGQASRQYESGLEALAGAVDDSRGNVGETRNPE